jgi:hypothetical protein
MAKVTGYAGVVGGVSDTSDSFFAIVIDTSFDVFP